MLRELYQPSLALLTDLYQLTMAAGYHRSGIADRRATFHLTFRRPPYGGSYAVAAGLGPAVEYLSRWRFDTADLDHLATLRGNDGRPLFTDAFLAHLGAQRFACDVDAVPEGTVVAAHTPLVRIQGPLLQAQIVETALLTIINFQTLIATKAARVCQSAGPDGLVLEFGLRRAQGIDGSLSATRAAFIGGVDATSNVLASRLMPIPVKGTHAHAWVMVWEDEVRAFEEYAEAMPHNCILLVDTYDTIEGVRRAVGVGQQLRRRGHELAGIRLDSGDLAALSIEARRILDDAGFTATRIVASNDLDEHRIAELRGLGAPITVWGVGTRLATGHPQPALGGVYKLSAIEDDAGQRTDRIKLSSTPAKVSNPGVHQVRRRYTATGQILEDILYDVDKPGQLPAATPTDRELLVPVMRAGQAVCEPESLQTIRRRVTSELHTLTDGQRKLVAADPFELRLEAGLQATKAALMARGGAT